MAARPRLPRRRAVFAWRAAWVAVACLLVVAIVAAALLL
jgi:hypothetical protein